MEIKKIRRKEGIGDISDKILSSITTSVTTGQRDKKGRFVSQLLPDNGWAVLTQFVKSGYSFSVNELHKKFRGSIHINTIRSLIYRLKENAWIVLYLRRTGKTHSENRYKLTLDGMAVWKMYVEKSNDL